MGAASRRYESADCPDRTFLKRKGGLFKKAYELSVLCSVDVAVIIFGHNKKLYEFSSGDINETLRRYQYVRRECNPQCRNRFADVVITVRTTSRAQRACRLQEQGWGWG
jgi:hypothetical protein